MGRGGRRREEVISEVAVKMLEVVEKIHGMGFIHRDIKPSNFRVKDGEVYITDFGTVRAYLDENAKHV